MLSTQNTYYMHNISNFHFCTTGKPILSDMPASPPWVPDTRRRIEPPFSLFGWLDKNAAEVATTGQVRLFDTSYQSDILVLGGKNPRDLNTTGGETLLWQLRGASKVVVDGKNFDMMEDDMLLVPEGAVCKYTGADDGKAASLSTLMDPNNKKRIPPQE